MTAGISSANADWRMSPINQKVPSMIAAGTAIARSSATNPHGQRRSRELYANKFLPCKSEVFTNNATKLTSADNSSQRLWGSGIAALLAAAVDAAAVDTVEQPAGLTGVFTPLKVSFDN